MNLRQLIEQARGLLEQAAPPGERKLSNSEFDFSVELQIPGEQPSSVARHYDGDSPIHYRIISTPSGKHLVHQSDKNGKLLTPIPVHQIDAETHDDAVSQLAKSLEDPQFSSSLRTQTQRPRRALSPR